MSRKWLLRPSLALIGLMSRSQAAILNPDRNPFLNKLMRWTLYNHFAAGTSREEVAKTSAEIKGMGCGVILGYAKEVVLQDPTGAADKDKSQTDYLACHYEAVEEWKQGTLKTLRMIGPGDFLYVK
jgi:proline dehydrogenase